MTSLLDDATAVRPAGPGRWDADVRGEFEIVNGHPNGGYLLTLLGRAAVAALGDDDLDVVGATATYISAPSIGPASIETTLLRRGRTASQVRAALVQDGTTSVDVVMTVGHVPDGPPTWGVVAPVQLPDRETCRAAGVGRRSPVTDGAPPMAKVLSMDFDPAVTGFAAGRPGGEGELRAWLSLADGSDWTASSLLFAVDALPPATFEVALTGWVPTLSPGPLSVRFRANVITGGFVDETADLWDSTGRLVAQSTQLAAIRMPES